MSAPTKLWCPNCSRRTKADVATWDTNGGDFWWCEAWPILPAFTGGHRNGMARKGPGNPHWGGPINLKNFEQGTSYHDGLAAMNCPLFEGGAA